MSARHDPTYLANGRLGRWAECSCGWKYGPFARATASDAQLAFGQHLLESVKPS